MNFYHRLHIAVIGLMASSFAFMNVGKSMVFLTNEYVSDLFMILDQPQYNASQEEKHEAIQVVDQPITSRSSLSHSIDGIRQSSSASSSTRSTNHLSSSSATRMEYIYSSDYLKSIRELNILLFITTIFSNQHIEYFNCCWPRLMEYSPLLSNAHVAVFGNNYTEQPKSDMEQIRSLFVHNPSFRFRFAPESDVEEIAKIHSQSRKLQLGANLGLDLAAKNDWFKPHDWVIRINPDVLIRDSDWIIQTMKNETVDGIFVKCTPGKIHTDFFAVRTMMFNHTTFSVMVDGNHERTAYTYFQPILESGRYALLPMEGPSRGFCRVGDKYPQTAIVYHGHGSCGMPTAAIPSSATNQSQLMIPPPPICNDLDGWGYQQIL